MNKKKIFNDPVYGFITLPDEIIYDLIEHPYFQRLRRIRQLGLAHVVYPGALHTRFHHALGALHLMTQAVETLKSKGHAISAEEAQAVDPAVDNRASRTEESRGIPPSPTPPTSELEELEWS